MHEEKKSKIKKFHEKKAKLSISLSASTIQIVDELRGNMTRSGAIDNLIQSQLNFMIRDSHSKKAEGIFYTPEIIADYMARLAINHFLDHSRKEYGKTERYSVLDPACGEGELLNSFINVFPDKQIQWTFYGVDKDIAAVNKCNKRLRENINILKHSNIQINAEDSLNTAVQNFAETNSNSKKRNCFDIVIANPPWGADLSRYGSALNNTFLTAKGQFDSADLFLELGISLLRPNGILVYILPDSLFSLGKSTLRKFILEKTNILLIARLGEKFFQNVNRACCILVCQKKTPTKKHRVKVYRLTPQERALVISKSLDLETIEEKRSHLIPQSRFTLNDNYEFDIDLSEDESIVFHKLRSSQVIVGDFFQSYRGVELSKHGYIYQCPKCKIWMPLPHISKKLCSRCGSEFRIDKKNAVQITSKQKKDSYSPIISGESILRYKNMGCFWIDQTKNGINYKEKSFYQGDKIIVRKTGVGISATIDYTGAMTTQVVYSIKKKQNVKAFPLEVLLAVLNSRAIFYYITKLGGETEWRSHPYLTQSTLMNIPLPNFNKLQRKKFTDIISIVKKSVISSNISPKEDIYIEREVASYFCLTRKDYEYIYEVINSVQELIPVRLLKSISIDDIFTK